ncbi:hypothetical protein RMATCC62417_10856 [Rhizopus microsporus]|nr:hypothetical protein RMATCC62417_10856 [Rhizopus microsporus]
MSTANTVVKDLYDNAHSLASTGIIKNIDLNIRLCLSSLFPGEGHQLQPISLGFVVQRTLSPFILQNIEVLVSTMNNDDLLPLDYSVSNKEELQINRILQDIYFKHSAAQYRNHSEFSLITDCISCLCGTLWSFQENVRLVCDNTSLANSSKSPDNISIRPDMIFSTKLACGTELEIANRDKARVRVLETAKRQLHIRLQTISAGHKHITFGALIYGKC